MSQMSNNMRMIFTISIILNVLLIGWAAGMAYKHYTYNPMQKMQAEMSPEARNIVARTMQKAFREGREEMKKARAVKKDIKAILSAPEFDAEAFDAKAKTLSEIMRGMGQRRIEVTKELASQLSAADRKVLSERFSRGFHGHDKKTGKDRPHAFLKDHDRKDESAYTDGPDLPEDMPPAPQPK